MFGKEYIPENQPQKKSNYHVVNLIQSLKTVLPIVKMSLVFSEKDQANDVFKKYSHHISVIVNRTLDLMEVEERDVNWVKTMISRQASEVLSYHMINNKEIDWYAWYDLLPVMIVMAKNKTNEQPAFKKLKMENTHNIAILSSFNKLLLSWINYKNCDDFQETLKQSFDWIYSFSKKKTNCWALNDSSAVEKMELFRVWIGEVSNVFNCYFNKSIKSNENLNLKQAFEESKEMTFNHFAYIDEKIKDIKI